MDATYITAFVESARSVFDTMLRIKVSVGKPVVGARLQPPAENEVSGIIGMTGDVIGTVVLSFPRDTAERSVEGFAGMKIPFGTPDFADAIGELVNMVSGAAKAKFTGQDVSISCPSVVVGAGHFVQQPSDATTICLPFTSSAGNFSVAVAIRLPAAQAAPNRKLAC